MKTRKDFMDDKLREILQSFMHFDEGKTPYPGIRESIAQIKAVFAYEDIEVATRYEKGKPIKFYYKNQMLMAGSEWYQMFEREVQISNPRYRTAYLEAAKKASGL